MITVACVTASVQIAACESNREVVCITGADVVVGELQLVGAAGGGWGRAATKRESGSAMSKERCSAKGSLSTAKWHPASTAAAGSTAENLVGSAHVVLSGGDVDAACIIHCHGFTGDAKYIGIADRNQSAAVEHEGSYTRFFSYKSTLNLWKSSIEILTLNFIGNIKKNSKRIKNSVVKSNKISNN